MKPTQGMKPNAHIRNPLVDIVVGEVDGVPARIDISSYSAARGFAKDRLSRDEDGIRFEAALRLLLATDDADLAAMGLSADALCTLWRSGLIILPEERADAFAAPGVFAMAREAYAAQGFTLIPECVTMAATAILAAHYRTEVAGGRLKRGDKQSDRYHAHNDPAARVVQGALRPAVERIVGVPIKGSYTYASLYCGGATLDKHIDRPQCKYTVSLLIDHRPTPSDGRSSWPVEVYLGADVPPVACFQSLGGGILFRGHEIPHGRPALAPGEESWVILLHYVDADFDGPLD